MRGVCGKILLVILPILLVVAGFRLATYGNPPEGGGLFPQFERLYAFFANSPNGVVAVRELIAQVNSDLVHMNESFASIGSWEDFWSAIGQFFQTIGTMIRLGVRVIWLPIEYVVWFFGQGYSLLAY